MKSILLVVIICVLFLSVSIIAAQDDGNPCYLKGGTMVNNQCVINGDLKISVEYPIDLAQNPLVAETIDPFINKLKDDLIRQLGPDLEARGGYLDITYEEYHHSDTIVSLVFKVLEGYGFQVHGLDTFQTFTFDLRANKLLTLNDLFLPQSDFLTVLAPVVDAALTQKLGDIYTDKVGNTISTYQAFALDQDALVFYFGDYQLGSYSLGQQSISIPLSQLNNVLKPEFAS